MPPVEAAAPGTVATRQDGGAGNAVGTRPPSSSLATRRSRRTSREVLGTPDAVAELAESCRACLQCGRCRSACPQGMDLAGGPRAVIRLILAQDVDRLLDCEDAWRCSQCGACTAACPMGIDVAGAVASVRRLQRTRGGPRCPERAGALLATRRLRRHPAIDGLAMGFALAGRGFLPRHPLDAVRLGLRSLRGRLARAPVTTSSGADARAFFPGCSLTQDRAAYSATCALAAAAGLRLADGGAGRCCGHPSLDTRLSWVQGVGPPAAGESLLTACPACERTLAGAGTPTMPIWQALVARAHRGELRLAARSSRFVPYAGCLSDRDASLGLMTQAAEMAGAEPVMTNPSLHAGCCGGLGGLYRAPSRAVTDLLAFAAEKGAPIVTPCLLCRDVVRAAASRRQVRQEVFFWPEFFRPATAGPASGAGPVGAVETVQSRAATASNPDRVEVAR